MLYIPLLKFSLANGARAVVVVVVYSESPPPSSNLDLDRAAEAQGVQAEAVRAAGRKSHAHGSRDRRAAGQVGPLREREDRKGGGARQGELRG